MKGAFYIPILSFIILFLTCSCSKIKSKYDEAKDEIIDILRLGFYSDPGAWDYYRVPLIAPYELSAIDVSNRWNCLKRRREEEFGCYSGHGWLSARLSVEYVGICDSVIYLSYTEELCPLNEMPRQTYDGIEMRRFVIIDVPTDSVEWHETREEWLSALSERNIKKIELHQVDSLYDDFAYNRRLLFTP